MPRYSVALLKRVSDDTGHEAEIVQHEVELDADDPQSAVAAANEDFCRAEGIGAWSDRADEIRVREMQPDGLPSSTREERGPA